MDIVQHSASMSWSCQYDEKSLVRNQWGSFTNVIISEAQYLCPLSLSLFLYLCYSSLIIWLVLIAELYMSPHHLLLELFKITDPSHGWQGNCVNTNFPTTIKLRLTILLNTHWLAGWHWLHSELLGGEPCLPWHQIMLVKCTLIMFVFLYWAAALDILFRENIKSRHLNFPQTIWY